MSGRRSVECIDGSRNLQELPGMTCCADSRCGVLQSSGSKTWVIAMRPVVLLLLVAISVLGQDAPSAPSSFSITGVVKSGNTPIPGATVIATNSSAEAKATTSTDINGAYTLQVTAAGKYQLRVEMPAFAPSTRRPPTSTVISGAVSRSSCARSTSASSGAMNCSPPPT